MESIKTVAIIIVLASVLSVAMYITKNNYMVSVAAVGSQDVDESEYDRPLCERLIRFGQVAFDRGKFTEAKHFFQKAITVDPSHALAWKKYNMALLALISAKVETDPGFLPEFTTDTGVSTGTGVSDAPRQMPADSADNDDDGC